MDWIGGLSSIKGQIANLTKDLLTEENAEVDANSQIESLKLQLEASSAEIESLKTKNDELEVQLESLQLRLDYTKQQHKSQLEEKDMVINSLRSSTSHREEPVGSEWAGVKSTTHSSRFDSSGLDLASEQHATPVSSGLPNFEELNLEVMELREEVQKWRRIAKQKSQITDSATVSTSSTHDAEIQQLQQRLAEMEEARQLELVSLNHSHQDRINELIEQLTRSDVELSQLRGQLESQQKQVISNHTAVQSSPKKPKAVKSRTKKRANASRHRSDLGLTICPTESITLEFDQASIGLQTDVQAVVASIGIQSIAQSTESIETQTSPVQSLPPSSSPSLIDKPGDYSDTDQSNSPQRGGHLDQNLLLIHQLVGDVKRYEALVGELVTTVTGWQPTTDRLSWLDQMSSLTIGQASDLGAKLTSLQLSLANQRTKLTAVRRSAQSSRQQSDRNKSSSSGSSHFPQLPSTPDTVEIAALSDLLVELLNASSLEDDIIQSSPRSLLPPPPRPPSSRHERMSTASSAMPIDPVDRLKWLLQSHKKMTQDLRCEQALHDQTRLRLQAAERDQMTRQQRSTDPTPTTLPDQSVGQAAKRLVCELDPDFDSNAWDPSQWDVILYDVLKSVVSYEEESERIVQLTAEVSALRDILNQQSAIQSQKEDELRMLTSQLDSQRNELTQLDAQNKELQRQFKSSQQSLTGSSRSSPKVSSPRRDRSIDPAIHSQLQAYYSKISQLINSIGLGESGETSSIEQAASQSLTTLNALIDVWRDAVAYAQRINQLLVCTGLTLPTRPEDQPIDDLTNVLEQLIEQWCDLTEYRSKLHQLLISSDLPLVDGKEEHLDCQNSLPTIDSTPLLECLIKSWRERSAYIDRINQLLASTNPDVSPSDNKESSTSSSISDNDSLSRLDCLIKSWRERSTCIDRICQLLASTNPEGCDKDPVPLLESLLTSWRQTSSQLGQLDHQRQSLAIALQQKHAESQAYHEELQKAMVDLDAYKLELGERQKQADELSVVSLVAANRPTLTADVAIDANPLIEVESDAQQQLASSPPSGPSDNEQRLAAQLDVLQKHLIEIEESYTAEALNAEAREVDLRQQISNLQDVASRHSVESSEQARWERDQAKRETACARQQIDELTVNLTNLQAVLQSFQREQEAAVEAETDRIRGELKRSVEAHKEAASKVDQLTRQLITYGDVEARLVEVTNQSNAGAVKQTRLEEQLHRRDSEIAALKETLVQVTVDTGSKIDKLLIKNLLMSYLRLPSAQQSDGLRIIGGLLNFTDEDYSKVYQESGTVVPKLMGWFKSAVSHIPAGPPPELASLHPDKSFADLLVNFLQQESRGSQLKLPTDHYTGQTTTISARKRRSSGDESITDPSPVLLNADDVVDATPTLSTTRNWPKRE